MKSYPSILGISRSSRKDNCPIGRECYAFAKYDGSNIRAEWSRKKGWYKFGTRRTMFDARTPFWNQVIPLWHEQLDPFLNKVFNTPKYRKIPSFTVFAEFFGEKSFAGQHVDDDPKRLIVIDVNPFKQGFISPEQFVWDFSDPCTAELVYDGYLNEEFIEMVRDGKLGTFEGVMAKGGEGHDIWMRKIKNRAWIEKVKSQYPSNWQEFHDSEDE